MDKRICGAAALAFALTGGAAFAASEVPAWNALGNREETVAFFCEHEYGVRPVERPPYLTFKTEEPDKVMMEGAAVRKRVRITYGGRYGTNSFVVTAFVPTKTGKPAPSFVLICNRNQRLHADPNRVNKSDYWPAEEMVRRGYAAINFRMTDIAPDRHTGNRVGVFECFENLDDIWKHPNRWGTLSAWAWGASRVLDWIETEPTLDAKHVAVIGQSRGGKTALLAAATDARFAMACVNNSGCSGAKLNHMVLPWAERVVDILTHFQYWFCQKYVEAANREETLPWDQHQLLGTIAPRLLCVGAASLNDGAAPRAEFEACRLASPAWEAHGLKGLCSDKFPEPGGSVQIGCISFHLRDGKHSLERFDWDRYMDFADKHGWTK